MCLHISSNDSFMEALAAASAAEAMAREIAGARRRAGVIRKMLCDQQEWHATASDGVRREYVSLSAAAYSKLEALQYAEA